MVKVGGGMAQGPATEVNHLGLNQPPRMTHISYLSTSQLIVSSPLWSYTLGKSLFLMFQICSAPCTCVCLGGILLAGTLYAVMESRYVNGHRQWHLCVVFVFMLLQSPAFPGWLQHIIWISFNWKLNYLDFSSDSRDVTLVHYMRKSCKSEILLLHLHKQQGSATGSPKVERWWVVLNLATKVEIYAKL